MEKPKLIKDLGLKSYGSYQKSVGIFECPECGRHFETRINAVRSGNTKTCGDRAHNRGRTIHGGKGTRLYECWMNMRHRTSESASPHHKKYYSDINVCPEWDSFADFREWAMSNGYSDDLVIDRINSRGDYEPDNCQWITQADNARKAMMEKYHPVLSEHEYG